MLGSSLNVDPNHIGLNRQQMSGNFENHYNGSPDSKYHLITVLNAIGCCDNNISNTPK